MLLAFGAREDRCFLADQLPHFPLVVLVYLSIFVDSLEKWHKSDDHLVSDNAQSPPVDLIGVALLKDGLRCHVIGRSTDSLSDLVSLFLFDKSG